MKKASLLLLSLSALLIASLACSLSNIAYEITGKSPQPQSQPLQEQSSSRQEQPADDNSAANKDVQDAPPSPQSEGYSSTESATIYVDDFSSSEGGWNVQSSDNIYTDYVDGAFHVAVYSSFYDAWANSDFYYGGDARIEVDATPIGGEHDNDYGVLCRYSGTPSNPSFYFFEISSDGYAVIGKTIDGIPEYLSSTQMMPSNAINQGYATNHLRADCIGTQLSFYVNDSNVVASVTDYSLYSGYAGLIVGTFDAAYVEVAFDDFIVVVP